MDSSVLQERRVSIEGVSTVLLEGGPTSSDSALVFVHGNPGSGQDWAALAQEAAAFSRVLAFDMPGFGHADKPADFPYTVEGCAAYLGALLDSLHVARAHLVLHDFGGPWGLAWAASHPDRVASATLINTGILPGYRWHYMARIWRTPVVGELFHAIMNRPGFHFAMRHGNPRGLPEAFVDRMYDDYDSGTKRAILKLYRATSDPDGQSRAIIDVLKAMKIPALVVWGARDVYLPAKYAALQRLAFPDAEIVTLQDSGHWPFADNPLAVSDAVMPFWRLRTLQDKAIVAA